MADSDVISLLTEDHRRVDELFNAYEQTDDANEKHHLVRDMITELSIHAAVEEQFLYPVMRDLPDGDKLTDEALQEHLEAKQVLADLDGMHAGDPELDRRVQKLVEDVRHHVEEEENELFPKLREALAQERLLQMGQAIALGKLLAPTHPHPEAPNAPPANLVVGPAAGIVDRFRDLLTSGESPDQLQQQVLDLVTRSQDAIVKAVKAWTDTVSRLLPDLPPMSGGEPASRPANAIDQAFDFAERLLASQRRFARELLGGGRGPEEAWEETGERQEQQRSQPSTEDQKPSQRGRPQQRGGRGGGEGRDYAEMSLQELRELARDRNLPGRSGLSKQELIGALKKADKRS
jgi:hemerythrin superfamily protein